MSDEWRVSVINREFLLCGSYPPLFYVPAEIQVSGPRELIGVSKIIQKSGFIMKNLVGESFIWCVWITFGTTVVTCYNK